MLEPEGIAGSAGLLIICTMIARKRRLRRLKEKVQAKVGRIPRGKEREKAKKAEKAAKREKVKEKARILRKNRRTETEADPFLTNLRAG